MGPSQASMGSRWRTSARICSDPRLFIFSSFILVWFYYNRGSPVVHSALTSLPTIFYFYDTCPFSAYSHWYGTTTTRFRLAEKNPFALITREFGKQLYLRFLLHVAEKKRISLGFEKEILILRVRLLSGRPLLELLIWEGLERFWGSHNLWNDKPVNNCEYNV